MTKLKKAIISVLDYDLDGYNTRTEIRGVDTETGEIIVSDTVEWGLFNCEERRSRIREMFAKLRYLRYDADFNVDEPLYLRKHTV